MYEEITLSQLTKSYVDGHAVLCDGFIVKYEDKWNFMSGRSIQYYHVEDAVFCERFNTIKEVKDYIRENRKFPERRITNN